jgi:hypothetical protein
MRLSTWNGLTVAGSADGVETGQGYFSAIATSVGTSISADGLESLLASSMLGVQVLGQLRVECLEDERFSRNFDILRVIRGLRFKSLFDDKGVPFP